MNAPLPRVFVALDFPNAADATALADRLDPRACGLKVGKELFVTAGPDPVRRMVERGFAVFLDLKFHDIPNTTASACAAATRLGVSMLNVHASGGRAMMSAARQAVDRTAGEMRAKAPLLIAVTVLTSLGEDDLAEIGYAGTARELSLRMAALTKSCGLDGVVCSAQEAAALRAHLGGDFKLVTPGIRLADAAQDDQVRIVTPEAALRSGADYLVIGRPITQATDPVATLERINASLAST